MNDPPPYTTTSRTDHNTHAGYPGPPSGYFTLYRHHRFPTRFSFWRRSRRRRRRRVTSYFSFYTLYPLAKVDVYLRNVYYGMKPVQSRHQITIAWCWIFFFIHLHNFFLTVLYRVFFPYRRTFVSFLFIFIIIF